MLSTSKSTRRTVLSVLGAAAVACSLPAFSQTINLKAAHSAAMDEPYQVGMVDFAKRVSAATGGKVAVTVFPNNQLGNERELIEGLPLGIVDVAAPANAVLTNFIPDLVTLDLPFLFRDQAHLERMRQGEISLVAPFRYSALLVALLMGYAVWGEMPNAMAWSGILLLLVSGVYLVHSSGHKLSAS